MLDLAYHFDINDLISPTPSVYYEHRFLRKKQHIHVFFWQWFLRFIFLSYNLRFDCAKYLVENKCKLEQRKFLM